MRVSIAIATIAATAAIHAAIAATISAARLTTYCATVSNPSDLVTAIPAAHSTTLSTSNDISLSATRVTTYCTTVNTSSHATTEPACCAAAARATDDFPSAGTTSSSTAAPVAASVTTVVLSSSTHPASTSVTPTAPILSTTYCIHPSTTDRCTAQSQVHHRLALQQWWCGGTEGWETACHCQHDGRRDQP